MKKIHYKSMETLDPRGGGASLDSRGLIGRKYVCDY